MPHVFMTRRLPCHLLFAAAMLAQSKVPIENDQVTVIDAYQQPHVRTDLHEHKFNRVMIYEQAGRQEFLDVKKKPRNISFKAGEVQWSPISGMHTAEIISENPVAIIEIELKKAGNPSLPVPGPLDPVKVSAPSVLAHWVNASGGKASSMGLRCAAAAP